MRAHPLSSVNRVPPPLSDEDAFEPEVNAPAEKVFGPEDFFHDDEAERRAMELAWPDSEATEPNT
jgi:hypothetical protein